MKVLLLSNTALALVPFFGHESVNVTTLTPIPSGHGPYQTGDFGMTSSITYGLGGCEGNHWDSAICTTSSTGFIATGTTTNALQTITVTEVCSPITVRDTVTVTETTVLAQGCSGLPCLGISIITNDGSTNTAGTMPASIPIDTSTTSGKRTVTNTVVSTVIVVPIASSSGMSISTGLTTVIYDTSTFVISLGTHSVEPTSTEEDSTVHLTSTITAGRTRTSTVTVTKSKDHPVGGETTSTATPEVTSITTSASDEVVVVTVTEESTVRVTTITKHSSASPTEIGTTSTSEVTSTPVASNPDVTVTASATSTESDEVVTVIATSTVFSTYVTDAIPISTTTDIDATFVVTETVTVFTTSPDSVNGTVTSMSTSTTPSSVSASTTDNSDYDSTTTVDDTTTITGTVTIVVPRNMTTSTGNGTSSVSVGSSDLASTTSTSGNWSIPWSYGARGPVKTTMSTSSSVNSTVAQSSMLSTSASSSPGTTGSMNVTSYMTSSETDMTVTITSIATSFSTFVTSGIFSNSSSVQSPRATSDITPPLSMFTTTSCNSSTLIATSSNHAQNVTISTTTSSVPVSTSAVPTGIPEHCFTGVGENGAFVVNWDDNIPAHFGNISNLTAVQPVPYPYHHMMFSNGFGYVTPPSKIEPFNASSVPNMAIFQHAAASENKTNGVLPGEIGAGPRAYQKQFWFNATKVNVGCIPGSTVGCTISMSALRWDDKTKDERVDFTHTVVVAPECRTRTMGSCKTMEVELPAGKFDALSGIQFTSKQHCPDDMVCIAVYEEVDFVIDDLTLAWYDDSCKAGIYRAGHGKK